ncbi:DUF4097 family beta strand repeat-containing protein [Kitasatospora sp. NPDC088351]|uniref:DUF4097 family beta strand repeat-containing protein n=1 Tax=unclassified Kitasatospora TaxID=2633591 RepID=UPI0034191042
MRERRGWQVTGTLALALVMAFGVVQTWAMVVQQRTVSERSYDVAVTKVQLDTGSAAVRIRPGPEGRVVVHQNLDWMVRAPVVSTSFEGTVLTVRMRCNQVLPMADLGCGAMIDLEVPAAASVAGEGTSGSVEIADLRGDVRLSLTSGAIHLTGLSGQVYASTTSGMVQAKGLSSARAEVSVASGSVELEFSAAPRSVDVSTRSGSLELTLPRDAHYNFTGDIGSGSRHIDPTLADSSSPNSVRVSVGSGVVSIDAAGN